jgi:hypothetical protein
MVRGATLQAFRRVICALADLNLLTPMTTWSGEPKNELPVVHTWHRAWSTKIGGGGQASLCANIFG